MVITSSGMINFYEDKFDFNQDPNKFLMSFPVIAIEKVIEGFDNTHLMIDYE